jgi:hypothetical protein
MNLNEQIFQNYLFSYIKDSQKILENKNNKIKSYFIRCEKENFIANERKINIQQNLVSALEKKDFHIVDTYVLNNIFEQNTLLFNSSIFVCDMGSNYFVNSIHCQKGTKIHVIDPHYIRKQLTIFPCWKIIHKIITKNCVVAFSHFLL